MATQPEIEYPRKLTIKTIMGNNPDVEELLKKEGKRDNLCIIFGVATRAKPGQSDLGPYVKFLGQFRAQNLKDRRQFESSVCILPRFLEEQLFGAMGAEGALNVEFAFQISVKYDKEAATKYVYEARNLVPAKESDALAALTARVGEASKALSAPKK